MLQFRGKIWGWRTTAAAWRYKDKKKFPILREMTETWQAADCRPLETDCVDTVEGFPLRLLKCFQKRFMDGEVNLYMNCMAILAKLGCGIWSWCELNLMVIKIINPLMTVFMHHIHSTRDYIFVVMNEEGLVIIWG